MHLQLDNDPHIYFLTVELDHDVILRLALTVATVGDPPPDSGGHRRPSGGRQTLADAALGYTCVLR